MKQVGTHDLAVPLPVSDQVHLPHLASKIEGQYEVVTHDDSAKISYK